MHFANEMLDHFLGHIKICNHTFAHWPYGLDAARGAPEHQFGVFSDRKHLFDPVFDMIGYHRRLG